MDGRDIESRMLMWAVAEISWQDPTGAPCRAPATLEDTSASGACVRLRSPLAVGSVVTIRWHREQFAAVARNCRQDGRDFLVGVRREPATRLASSGGSTGKSRISASNGIQPKAAEATTDHPLLRALQAEHTRRNVRALPRLARLLKLPALPQSLNRRLGKEHGPGLSLQKHSR